MASTFRYPTTAKKPGDLNGRGVVFTRPGDGKRVRIKLGTTVIPSGTRCCFPLP